MGALGLFTFLPQCTVHNMRISEYGVPGIFLGLRQVIVDASQGHRRISREEHYLRAEMELLTHMSLLMLRRAKLLQSFDTEVDLSA